MMEVCKIHCFLEALSPITHMQGVSGNEALINRELIVTEDGHAGVPVLSGNALRHSMIRNPGALHLVSLYDLRGKLSLDQANFLFHGGRLCENTGADQLDLIASMYESMPLFRALGGSLNNQIVPGALSVGRGLLVCEESRASLMRMLPDAFSVPETRLMSSVAFVDGFQYTRGDADKSVKEFMVRAEADHESNLMIYNGQTVVRGALFYSVLILSQALDREIGAVLNALELWSESGGVIGGQRRVGHGRMSLKIFIEPDIDVEACLRAYRDYAESMREKAIDWLHRAFRKDPKKAASKKAEAGK